MEVSVVVTAVRPLDSGLGRVGLGVGATGADAVLAGAGRGEGRTGEVAARGGRAGFSLR